MKLTLAGDTIIYHPWSNYTDRGFLDLVQVLRQSDICFANLETLFHTYESYPERYINQGVPMGSDPLLAAELAWAGIDAVGNANNHTYDYGTGGVLATQKSCRDAGLVYAGAGTDEAEASAPVLIGKAGKTVAFHALTFTYTPWGIATPSNKEVPGKPGVHGMPVEMRIFSPFISAARKIAGRGASTIDEIYFKDLTIFGKTIPFRNLPFTSHRCEPHALTAFLRKLEASRETADIVVVSVHYHRNYRNRPSSLIERFTKRCIDHGADIVFGHGPHRILGIELYRGKPIFHSLGNFCFQVHSSTRIPADCLEAAGCTDAAGYGKKNAKKYGADESCWLGYIPVIEMNHDNKFDSIEILPIELRREGSEQYIGMPGVATRTAGDKVKAELRRRSSRYGTGFYTERESLFLSYG